MNGLPPATLIARFNCVPSDKWAYESYRCAAHLTQAGYTLRSVEPAANPNGWPCGACISAARYSPAA